MKNSPRDTGWQETNPEVLSLKQHYAMELLLIGKSNAEVAVLIGVDTKTISQWQNLDAEFIVAINALRAAVWEGSVERLRRLMEQALDVVEKAVARDAEIAAITLLQALGWQRDHH